MTTPSECEARFVSFFLLFGSQFAFRCNVHTKCDQIAHVGTVSFWSQISTERYWWCSNSKIRFPLLCWQQQPSHNCTRNIITRVYHSVLSFSQNLVSRFGVESQKRDLHHNDDTFQNFRLVPFVFRYGGRILRGDHAVPVDVDVHANRHGSSWRNKDDEHDGRP